MTPLDELRAAVEAAAADLRDGGAAGDRADAWSAPRRPASATTRPTPRCCSRPRSASRRARSPSGSARRCATGWAARRPRRGRRARASSTCSWPTPGTSTPSTRVLAAGDAFGAGGRSGRARPDRVRLGQPDRSADRGRGPPRRVRRRAGADPRARREHASSASTTSTTPAARCSGSARRSARGRAARSRPRTATRATTSPSWPSRSPTPPTATPTELAREGVEILIARHPRRRSSASACTSTAGSSRRRSTRASRAPGTARASELEADGHAYEHDGALWLRTTDAPGDEKDRVLVRSTGEPTYFAADVAYHWDKLDRGYDRLVNVLGADHHSYVARLRAVLAAARRRPRPRSRCRCCSSCTSSRAASARRCPSGAATSSRSTS